VANATETTSSSRLFAAMRETQDEQLRLGEPNEHARARARLLQAVDRVVERESATVTVQPSTARHGRRWGLGWGVGAGIAAAACALALVLVLPDSNQPDPAGPAAPVASLAFELDGAPLEAKAEVVADARPRRIAVSDGTRLELAAGGRMVIDTIRSSGATVTLDRGELALAVHHEDDTSWQVAAGPWTVHVTGTQFVVAWEPQTEHFRVAVSEGSVRVAGPDGEVAKLRAGEELVRTRLASEPLATREPELRPAPGAALEPEPEPEPERVHRPHSPSASKPKPAARRWDSYFDDGDYLGAWAVLDGQRGGIHAEAERADDARTMLDLADIARFTTHPSDSRKLLERLRVRFPTSHEASEAAFALGRLASDAGSQAKAVLWFERYLDERPDGSFAGDALGRLMDCYDALDQPDAAMSAATRYLASHAAGPHAAKAEKILAR
jgi:ferric-dicitrate binding protein FerR (iron transport regulator)